MYFYYELSETPSKFFLFKKFKKLFFIDKLEPIYKAEQIGTQLNIQVSDSFTNFEQIRNRKDPLSTLANTLVSMQSSRKDSLKNIETNLIHRPSKLYIKRFKSQELSNNISNHTNSPIETPSTNIKSINEKTELNDLDIIIILNRIE